MHTDVVSTIVYYTRVPLDKRQTLKYEACFFFVPMPTLHDRPDSRPDLDKSGMFSVVTWGKAVQDRSKEGEVPAMQSGGSC